MDKAEAEATPVATPNADRAVGLALQILALLFVLACMLAFSLIGSFVLGLFGSVVPFAVNGDQAAPPDEPPWIHLLVWVALAAPFIYSLLVLLSGTAIKRSKRWGFGLMLVLAGLLCPIGGGSAAFAIPTVVYCVLRLNGRLGANPV